MSYRMAKKILTTGSAGSERTGWNDWNELILRRPGKSRGDHVFCLCYPKYHKLTSGTQDRDGFNSG